MLHHEWVELLGNTVSPGLMDILPRHMRVRGDEVASHFACNAIATDVIPMDMMDILKSVTEGKSMC